MTDHIERDDKDELHQELVSVIVLYYRDPTNIRNCLESVKNQSYKNLQVIFVDNHSQDGIGDSLETQYACMEFHKLSENRGFCGGNNYALKFVRGEYVLFLNSDVILDTNYIKIAISCFCTDRKVGAVTGKVFRFDRCNLDSTGLFITRWLSLTDRGAEKNGRDLYNQSGHVFGCVGAVFFVRKMTIEAIHLNNQLFDEDFFAFMEDGDASYRINLAGFSILYEHKAIAFHARGSSSTGVGKHRFWQKASAYQYFALRNRYYFILKNISLSHILLNLHYLIPVEILIAIYCLYRRELLKVYLEIFRRRHELMSARKYRKGHYRKIEWREFKRWLA